MNGRCQRLKVNIYEYHTFEMNDAAIRTFHLDGFVTSFIALELQIGAGFITHKSLLAFQYQDGSN